MTVIGKQLAAAVAVGASTCALALSCGGNTTGDPATGGQAGATGGRSETGGTPSASGGREPAGGRPETGGVPSTGGVVGTGGDVSGGEAGAGGDSRCALPPDPGPCNALFPSYYFDPAEGACRPFVYGGCGGNDNRFDTLAACRSECGGGARCELSSDCVAVPAPACCAACEPVTRDAFVAVHRDEAASVPIDCDVACGPCPDPTGTVPTSGNFFAECVDHECVLRDVRETSSAECTDDTDCHLRGGTACCESCGADRPVALNDPDQFVASLQCPDLACPPCLPDLRDYEAVCASGTCQAVLR